MPMRLFDAPHRIFFFAAAAQLLFAGAWWAATLVARARGVALPLGDGVAPSAAHALVMTYGFFPLFIFGFLHTVAPRWLDRPPPRRRDYAVPGLAAAGSAALLLPALHLGTGAAAAVLVPMLAAWGWMAGSHLAQLRASRVRDTLHARVVGIALLFGIAGLAFARHALLTGSPRSLELAGQLGLWAFLVPVFTAVCHRMVPCAGGGERAHGAALWILAAAAVVHALLAGSGLGSWTWLVDLPGAVLMLRLAWRWGWRGGSGKRLLAMLNVGFAWLTAAWLLHGAQSLLRLAGIEALGLAPVHALAIGALSALTLAMVGRLTAASSGQRVGDDRITWGAFWLVQAAACARVAADLAPAMYSPLLVAAVLAWLGGFACWSWRYMPRYLRR
jgi:uncharacterized protein involved in response to NO